MIGDRIADGAGRSRVGSGDGVREWAMPYLAPEEIEALERLAEKYAVPASEVIGWARNYRVSSPGPDLAEEEMKLAELKRRSTELEKAVLALPSQVRSLVDRRLTSRRRETTNDMLHILSLIQTISLPAKPEKRGRPVSTDHRVVTLVKFLAASWREAHGRERPLVSKGGVDKDGVALKRRFNQGGDFVADVVKVVTGSTIKPGQLETLTKTGKNKHTQPELGGLDTPEETA